MVRNLRIECPALRRVFASNMRPERSLLADPAVSARLAAFSPLAPILVLRCVSEQRPTAPNARITLHMRRAAARIDLSRGHWRTSGRSEALRELGDARTESDDGGWAAVRLAEGLPPAAVSHPRALHAAAAALRAGRGWHAAEGRARQARRRVAYAQLRAAGATSIGVESDECAGSGRARQDGPIARSVGGAHPMERNTAS